jgi:hypothetical protein
VACEAFVWTYVVVDQMRLLAIIFSFCVAVVLAGSNCPAAYAAKAIQDGPMRVVIVRNSDPACEPLCPQWIDAEGEIETTTPSLFLAVFRKMGSQKLPIVIRSPGGSIEASLIIGKMIRERGLTVAVGFTQFDSCSPADEDCKLPAGDSGVYVGRIDEVGAFCNSACPMILAAGVTRLAAPKAEVGLHEPRTEWTIEVPRYEEYLKPVPGSTKKIKAKRQVGSETVVDKVTYGLHKELRQTLANYYKDMGVDTGILRDMTKAKNSDMHVISEARKDVLKIRTNKTSALSLGAPEACVAGSVLPHCVLDLKRDPALKSAMTEQKLGFASDEHEMTFQFVRLVLGNCAVSCPAWIAADGVITRKTPEAFKKLIANSPGQKLPVVFHSSGGDVKAAMAFGALLREQKWETSIAQTKLTPKNANSTLAEVEKYQPGLLASPGRCIGACLLAYVGGIKSHAPKAAVIEVHNPQLYEAAAGPKSKQELILKYLKRMGVSAHFTETLMGLPREQVQILSQADMIAFAIASDSQDAQELLSTKSCKTTPVGIGCITLPPT